MIPEGGVRWRAGGPPWIILAVVAGASLASLLPGAAGILEYDRTAVEAGEIWRLLTGQLVHWTARMTAADLAVLLAVGAWLEIRCRRVALVALLAGALLVGLGLYGLAPELSHYRGSSGLASALFAAAALEMATASPLRWQRASALTALVLFAAKLFWELETGRALAAGPLLPGVVVTPSVHLLGGMAGLLARGLRRPGDLVRALPGRI